MLHALVAAMLAVFVWSAEDQDSAARSYQVGLLTRAVATEVASAPRPPVEWAALLLAVAENETHGSLRIHAGQCRPHECDRGRARGPWQEHRNRRNAPFWDHLHGVDNTAVQAASASEALKRSYWHWRRHCASVTPDWIVGTVTVYAGRSCLIPWSGAAARAASYRRFVSAGSRS